MCLGVGWLAASPPSVRTLCPAASLHQVMLAARSEAGWNALIMFAARPGSENSTSGLLLKPSSQLALRQRVHCAAGFMGLGLFMPLRPP